jgi:hypothetical protein
VTRVDQLSRERCRRVFEERFTVRTMAQGYLEVYRRLRAGPCVSPSEAA